MTMGGLKNRSICYLLWTYLAALGGQAAYGQSTAIKHWQERQVAPGTHISLPIPKDFRSETTGYFHTAERSSFIVVEVSTPFEESYEGFSSERLKEQNMKLLKNQEHLFGNVMGHVLHIEQKAHGDMFLKVIGMFPGSEGTALVSGVFPKSSSPKWASMMIETVKAARFEPKLKIDPFGGMPFTLAAPKGMLYSGRLGELALFSRTGELGKQSPDDPAFMAGPVKGTRVGSDQMAFALAHLKGLTPFEIGKIESETSTTIGGLPAVKLVAEAESVKSDIPMRVYQIMVFDKEATYMFLGSVGMKRAGEYLKAFETSALSFRKRKK